MAYELKDNTFSLFENDKRGNDKAPDYKGKGMINGKEVQVSIWKKTSASGISFMSGQVSEPYKKPEEKQDKEESITEAVADEIPLM